MVARNSNSAFWSNSLPWMIRICLRKVDLPLSPAPSSRILTRRLTALRSRASIASISRLLRLASRSASRLRSLPSRLGCSRPVASAGSRQRLRVRTTPDMAAARRERSRSRRDPGRLRQHRAEAAETPGPGRRRSGRGLRAGTAHSPRLGGGGVRPAGGRGGGGARPAGPARGGGSAARLRAEGSAARPGSGGRVPTSAWVRVRSAATASGPGEARRGGGAAEPPAPTVRERRRRRLAEGGASSAPPPAGAASDWVAVVSLKTSRFRLDKPPWRAGLNERRGSGQSREGSAGRNREGRGGAGRWKAERAEG